LDPLRRKLTDVISQSKLKAIAFSRQAAKISIDFSSSAAETTEIIQKEGGEAIFVKTNVTQAAPAASRRDEGSRLR
jgi:hypothetical protein